MRLVTIESLPNRQSPHRTSGARQVGKAAERPDLRGQHLDRHRARIDTKRRILARAPECRQANGRDVSSWLVSSLPGAWFAAFGGVEEGDHRRVSGNAVLSRWPIEHQAQSRRECHDAWPKVLLHVRTAGIDIYSAHLTAIART